MAQNGMGTALGKQRTVVAAAAVGALGVGAVVGGVWWSGRTTGAAEPRSACATTSRHALDVTAARLCVALSDGGLPEILGVPGERTRQGMWFGAPDSSRESDDIVHEMVQVGPYSVAIVRYRGFPLTEMEGGGKLTVGGHRADWFTTTTNGEQSWTVEAAWDAADSGAGTYSVLISNDRSPLGKEESLRLSTAIAEKVLPTLPDWRS
ncbi:DUF6215 domain-containing protein [Catenulispora yoronensis]|uniref:DUF6215 domain-containing protein n=1 Tax=Catenulispora yoronensis TaxID=450799 RepID=UPI0031D22F23